MTVIIYGPFERFEKIPEQKPCFRVPHCSQDFSKMLTHFLGVYAMLQLSERTFQNFLTIENGGKRF